MILFHQDPAFCSVDAKGREPVITTLSPNCASEYNAVQSEEEMMDFPKSYVLGAVVLVLVFALGLFIFVYFQGGVESAIHLSG